MDELKFKVSAELKNILGRDLITSDNIAILELVKNSYDAHATKVDITFDEDKIVIADNGKGMTLEELKNKWLFVGFSAKRDGTEDNSYRRKFKRNYAGAKGIGRISCDRLARYVTLTTKSEKSATVETLIVDWQSFEQKQKVEFDTVAVKHSSTEEDFVFPEGSDHGTMLSFSGLHTPWGKIEILELRKSLEKMINPFSDTDEYKIEIIAPAFSKEDERIKEKIDKIICNKNDLSDKEKLTLAQNENSIVGGIIKNSISDVLKIKTTQIESTLKDGIIRTKLSDRGEVMYEIEEINKDYTLLENVSINIYYLNRAAKYSFSMKMGVTPVRYGNIFLFRNGFRIWPYGEENDDSWGLNRRAQQGYNRTLGTRDLFGRVDVETSKVDDFKEVSSRDGGLIMTKPAQELMKFFTLISRRLERYVVGVLWGEGFIRNSYFQSEKYAHEAREKLKQQDKDQDNADSIFENIGSKVDFLQLVKSMVNDNAIFVKFYNAKLADVVSDVTASEIIHANVFSDLRKIAEQTNDAELASSIELFEKQMAKIRKDKEEAEHKAEESRLKALEEARKRKEEEEKRKQKEKELEAQKQKNLYLTATQHTSPEVKDLMHAIALSSNDLDSLIKIIATGLREKTITITKVINKLDEMSFHTSRIIKISKMLTKADINFISEAQQIDIQQYIKEYIQNFEDSIHINFGNIVSTTVKKTIPAIELSIVLDNLVSNSKKANATEIMLDFNIVDECVEVLFSDNGIGVDLEKFTKESIFDPGVTDRRGGSGIGLSTILNRMDKDLNGEIEFVGNGIKFPTGATFKLKFF